jgi:TRAP transporter TAXI family solute receptor
MFSPSDLKKLWYWFAFGIAATAFLAAGYIIFQTLPPRTIRMATGAVGGANYELGIRYRESLAKAGINLQLVTTSGSLENVARLRGRDSGVDVGFVQGGTINPKETPGVESLGTIFYEPLWLFVRNEIGNDIQALRGRRVSIGPEGSGGHALALDLAKRTKVDTIVSEFLSLPTAEAAEQLIQGKIDAAFIVAGWTAPVVQRLLDAPNIELGSFKRSDALIALYPFLNKLTLPAGIVDLLTNRPPADVMLLAPKASLAVRADLHPAIQHLLLSTAVQIHSQPGIFQRAGQFPAAESIDLPLSDEAQRFYKSGRPFLEEHLPFWLATLIERILVVFLPIGVLAYPLIKFLPQMYHWLMQSKIMRLYDEMRAVEAELNAHDAASDIAALNAKLDQIDERANTLRLPKNYTSMLYTLRSHLNLVRARLSRRSSGDLPR